MTEETTPTPATPHTPPPTAASIMSGEPTAAPSHAAAPPRAAHQPIWGTGRRKTAVARVRLVPGTGEIRINDRKLDEFFHIEDHRLAVMQPLLAAGAEKHVNVFVNVVGGGITGQSGAVRMGLARALCKWNADCEPKMREGRYLTRDSRKVERKKYGRSGARKRFQFSKR